MTKRKAHALGGYQSPWRAAHFLGLPSTGKQCCKYGFGTRGDNDLHCHLSASQLLQQNIAGQWNRQLEEMITSTSSLNPSRAAIRYVLTLERDLFGAFILYRRWFGLHNRRGGMKQQIFLNQDSALREFQRVERTRARRGYVPVSDRSSASPHPSAVLSSTGSLAVD